MPSPLFIVPAPHGRQAARALTAAGAPPVFAFRATAEAGSQVEFYQLYLSFNMAIDIYARWQGQSDAERDRQYDFASHRLMACRGHLRETYHGGPYATQVLVPEAFEHGHAEISASLLRERLPETLAVAETRLRRIYHDQRNVLDAQLKEVLPAFPAFIALCEWAEEHTGRPVTFIASY